MALRRFSSAPAPAGEKRVKRNRTLSISTIIILVLAAIAGVAYYLGTPAALPSAQTVGATCQPQDPQVVIPQNVNVKFTPPVLNVVVGINNTVGWDDMDGTYLHVVSSMSVPPGSLNWDFNMTAGDDYCVTLTVAGTYSYQIGFDPTTFSGIIIVKTGS